MRPLSSIIENKETRKNLRKIILDYQKEIMRERGLGFESSILEAIISIHMENIPLQVLYIAQRAQEQWINEDISARKCGEIIRKKLMLKTKRSKVGNNVARVVIWDLKKIKKLCKKYGLNFNYLTSLTSSENKIKNNLRKDSSIEGFVSLNSTDNKEERKKPDY